ncbi:S-layer homology domain-containing protein [Waterburya agarophytonicola K14]|uniref:S-layer homology domain-containing protein n=1 Tax=Waterburya agarophytonicola KI4 TaxID=2874699 RepID=A0A964BTL1_9CYAN|nr:S-layer homology domain-containing protein [Waterburya agarophytonicola]MCC0177947.1 S-layer homology domain-containing protein [Waterburya agarophytonicola KI4]
MLLKQNNPQVVKGILFTGLLTLLASCGNSSALESMVRADPKLIENRTQTNTQVKAEAEERKIASNNELKNTEEEITFKDNSPNLKLEKASNSIPESFPASFPIYPQAQLKEVKTGKNIASGMLTWTSSDNSKAIADYYQAELTANDWEIIKPFQLNPNSEIARAIATKGDRKVHLTLLRSSNSQTGNDGTKLSAIYEPLEQDIAQSDIASVDLDPEADLTAIDPPQKPTITKDKDKLEKNTNNQVQPSLDLARNQPENLAPENNTYIRASDDNFSDLDNVPEQLSQPLDTVAALGILTPYTKEGNVEVSKFAPNAIITRGEYARWLIAANNRYHEGDLGKKIYVANNTSEAAFQDIKSDNPDFGAIQGLAEAGLVPSRLTQDSTKLLFRPDAPLTREDLVTWKVPLDTRQALPKASIEAIEKSWGFQDAANIDSSAVRALYADYQNGDRSNVRRIFGFTTLFQPKKPVTRAEAAASLWYFGFQGDGITAQEILETEIELESNS